MPPGNVPREYEVLLFSPSLKGTWILGALASGRALHALWDAHAPRRRASSPTGLTSRVTVAGPLVTRASLLGSGHIGRTGPPPPGDQRTPEEVSSYLKSRYRSVQHHDKNIRELRRVTTCLVSDPTEDSAPRYSDLEACSFLFVAIDILTLSDGIRHYEFEGHTVETAKSLLFLVACVLKFLYMSRTNEPKVDPSTIEDHTESFFFSDTRKIIMQTRPRSVTCDTISDKDTLPNCRCIKLPITQMTLFLTFAQLRTTPSKPPSRRKSGSLCGSIRPSSTKGA